MRELPLDVFVAGQLSPAHIAQLAEQGVQSFINNRPDNEAPGQPLSSELAEAAQEAGVAYAHLPMAGMLTPDLLARNGELFADMPRPIVAFCASGTRSAALWAFAHAPKLGVSEAMEALETAGFPLPQLRQQIESHIARSGA